MLGYVKINVNIQTMGLEKCTPRFVHMPLIENKTMGLKLNIFLTKTSFIFLKFFFIFP